MQLPRAELPCAPVDIVSKPVRPPGPRQHTGKHNARGYGRSLEVYDLIRACRQGLRSHVKPGEPAYAAANEVNQSHPIPAAAQPGGKAKRGRRHAKREYIRQGVEFSSESGVLVPPPRDAPVKHVE